MKRLDELRLQYKISTIAQKIIYWNIVIYILSLLLFYSFKGGTYHYPSWISLSSNPDNLLYYPWTLLSYGFFHAGFLHLLFNLLILNFVSTLFFTFFSEKQFLGLYILGIIFSGLVYILLYFIISQIIETDVVLVGASAGIMAVLFGVVMYSPDMQVRLLLIGRVSLWQIAFVLVFLDLIQMPFDNMGGHIAHLGGAFFGIFYTFLLKKGIDLSKGIVYLVDKIESIFDVEKEKPFKKVYKNKKEVIPSVSYAKRRIIKGRSQQQLDDILDKISQSGYDSLNKEEKAFLFKVGNEDVH